MLKTSLRKRLTHSCNPEDWMQRDRNSLVCSDRSVALPRSFYTDTGPCCRHIAPRSLSLRHCRRNLEEKSSNKDKLNTCTTAKKKTSSKWPFIPTTYVYTHRDDPSGCWDWAGSPGRTARNVIPRCGANILHTHLRSCGRWLRTKLGQNDSAGRGCYTRSLRCT